MGPSIKKDSYLLEEYPNGYDLTGENIKQLLLKGVREENIIVDPTDTATDTNFFSHYRESRKKENEGRFLTTTMLV
jgi:copper oxidase (laccase) domain-containing protein